MSNLRTAILAIEAEINHAQKGLAYYMERVRSLEEALAGIVQAEGNISKASGTPSRVSELPAQKIKGKTKAAKKTRNKTEVEAGELPSTGGDYWKGLVNGEPKSAQAILAESVHGLGFVPTKTQVGKLMNRMTFTLNSLVKAGKIQDSGSGRERRFFKN